MFLNCDQWRRVIRNLTQKETGVGKNDTRDIQGDQRKRKRENKLCKS